MSLKNTGFWNRFEPAFVVFLLLLALILTSYFSFTQPLPILQTDGASFYVDALAFSKNLDMNEPIPAYNLYAAFETKVSDYPPVTIVSLGLLMKIFGSNIFFINGFFGALFFLVATFFFYRLCKKMMGSAGLSFFATLLFILNVRAYIFLFSGVLAAFVSFCLCIPAIYFTYLAFNSYFDNNENKGIINRLFKKEKSSDKTWMFLILAILFSFIVSMTYFQIFAFLFFVQFFMAIGFYLQKRFVLEFPKITSAIKINYSSDVLVHVILLFSSFIFLLLCLFLYVVRIGQRGSIVSEYVSQLLEPSSGLFYAWRIPFIVDGPIITCVFLFSLVYFFYKNRWNILSLGLPVLIFFLIPVFFFPKETFLLNYVFRANVLMYPLMIILVFLVFKEMFKHENSKKVAVFLIFCSVLIHILLVGVFFSIVGPAISFEQRDAAIYLSGEISKDPTMNVLYINNMNEGGLFKSFKWILVYSKPQHFTTVPVVSDKGALSEADYIFVADKDSKFVSDDSFISDYSLVFSNNDVLIYKK